jgi:hypothetical protein
MSRDLTGFGALFDFGSKLLDKFVADPQAKAQAQLELVRLHQTGELAKLASETQLAQGQIDINKIEAASDSLFKGGWRPSVGWACSGGLTYQILLRPIGGWIMLNAAGWQSLPPSLEMDTLLTLLFALLGLGAYRTREKLAGVA